MNLYEQLECLKWKQVPDKAVEIFQKHADELVKESYSPVANKLLQWADLHRGTFPGGIPNNPSPLASMLVAGLAGAGLGYGAGWLGEKVLPDSWQRGRLRKTLALLGGAVGASPGLMWGISNAAEGRRFNDNSLYQQPALPDKPKQYNPEVLKQFRILSEDQLPDMSNKLSEDIRSEISTAFEKVAFPYSATGFGVDAVPVNEFNQIIWGDPRVASRLDPPMQAAATGLITGAANLPGKRNTAFVTPMDVGRMAAGMGSGYLSGMLVGKALSIMTGMPPSTQNLMKNTGMYAGLIANLVPIAFGT